MVIQETSRRPLVNRAGCFLRRGWLTFSLFLLGMLCPGARGADATLSWGEVSLRVQDQASRLDVLFGAMRLNRVTGHWDVEVWVRSRGPEDVRSPVALVVEGLTGSGGLVCMDGRDEQGRPFVDFSQAVTNGVLHSGEVSSRRVVSFRREGDQAPRVTLRPFGKDAVPPKALATTRTLDHLGLPLVDVDVREDGPGGRRLTRSDAIAGAVTLGGVAGSHVWMFSKEGYMPVWRRAALAQDKVAILPHPRLTPRSGTTVVVGAGGGEAGTADGRVTARLGAGVLASGARVTLTGLDVQALPGFLPPGWSPLRALWFESDREPQGTVELRLALAGPLAAGESACLTRWDESRLEWMAEAVVASAGGSAITALTTRTGAFAIVVPDVGAGAPAVPVAGQALGAGSRGTSLPPGVVAKGQVTPPTSVASVVGERVTAQAELVVSNTLGALGSGAILRGRVAESYLLNDRSTRHPPRYESHLSLFQRPGDGSDAALRARFPLRPILLYGAAELTEARLVVDVAVTREFAGGVLGSDGGEVALDGVRVLAGAGDLAGDQAVVLERVEASYFGELAPAGAAVLDAVELTVGGVNPGRRLAIRFGAQAAQQSFVVARVLHREGLYGLEPVERLQSDADGRLSSAEPASGERLPGVTGSGQFVLVRMPSVPALVTGLARGSGGAAGRGFAVRVAGQPWLTFTDAEGRYRLVAAVGPGELSVTDGATGQASFVQFNAPERATIQLADAAVGPVGLRVAGVSPAGDSRGVPLVSAVTIQFNKPVNPGTLMAGGVQLVDASGQPVISSISLNLRNTVVTVLPNAQLAPATLYTLRLGDGVADPAGQLLEGARSFSFTTVSAALNREAAQLTSHEPAGGRARVVGTAGTAEPEAAVLLVNETTGRTATVLSKADGSFDNFIEADVDDVLSAVVVNRNGTQTRVPVGRQLFRDGRVGLFNGGGTLEAESDGGPVRVLVEPGSVSGKARFKLDVVGLAELLAAVKNTPPESGRLLGGLKIQVDGDPLSAGADISFPVRPQDLALPAGERPEDRAFVLCEPIEHEGVTVYRIVDTMRYEDGRLVTHSPPFEGVAFSMMVTPIMTAANAGQLMDVAGFVVSAPASIADQLDSEAIHTALRVHSDKIRPVPGTIVSAYPASLASQAIARAGLAPGTFVARANTAGFFAIRMPFNAFEHDAIMLLGQNPRLPGLRTSRSVPRPAFRYAVSAQLVFSLPESGEFADRFPPLIQPQPPSGVLPLNTNVVVPIILRDDASQPYLVSATWDPSRSLNLPGGEPVDPSVRIIAQTGRAEVLNSVSVSAELVLRVPRPMQVAVNLDAADGSGNHRTGTILLNFGDQPAEPPETIPPNDVADVQGPQVVSSLPHEDTMFAASDAITVQFNEPVRRAVARRDASGSFTCLTLRDESDSTTVNPAWVELSANQRTLLVYPGVLKPGHAYDLELNAGVRDLAGNPLDQVPTLSGNESFHLRFRTPPGPVTVLAQTDAPQATLIHGPWAFTIDRGPSLGNGVLRMHRVDMNPVPLLETNLPPFPRVMVKVPNYAYRRTPTGPVETNTLLAVIGGLTGPDQPGQWMQIWEITDPASGFGPNPARPPLVAGGFISIDPSSPVVALKWQAPRLSFVLNTPNGSLIQMLNLQAFILGAHYTDDEWNALPKPPTYDPGLDANSDGDFVDTDAVPPDRLPIPVRFTLHGLERTIQPAGGLYLSDFDVALGGALVVGTVLPHDNQPGRFQVFNSQGLPVGDGLGEDGGLEFPDERALRVTLDLDFPMELNGALESRTVALVAAGGRIAVVDLRNPLRPELHHRIGFGSETGTIGMLQRTGDDEYAVGTAHGVFLLRRTTMGKAVAGDVPHPSLREWFDVALSGRVAGVSSLYVAASDGTHARVQVRPPRLSLAHLVAGPVRSSVAVIGMPEDGIKAFLTSLRPGSFLAPAIVKSEDPAVPSGITDRLPEVHHYVLLEAPGSAGPSVGIAVESLDRNGRMVTPKGGRYPPVMLTDHGEELLLGGVQPAATALVARRLSDDPASALYSLFLSDPFVVVREPMEFSDRARLLDIPGRQAVWSGHYLRVSLEANAAQGSLDDFESKVESHRFIPGPNRVCFTLAGEYIDTPNPSFPGAAPRVAGVDLQSGELRESAVDILVEGRHQDLVFSRVYESRSRHAGILGHGWDFNLNSRILEIPEQVLPANFALTSAYYGDPKFDRTARPGDAVLVDGNGGTHVFRLISPEAGNEDKRPLYANDPAIAAFSWTGKIDRHYESPPGQFGVLYKFQDGTYVFVSTAGARTHYDSAGRLDRIVGAAEASKLVCGYADDGRLSRVTGDRGVALAFDYWVPAWEPRVPAEVRRDVVAENFLHAGLLRRIRTVGGGDPAEEVLFDYDDEGRLSRVTDPKGRVTVYGYDEGRMVSVGRGDGAQFPAQTVKYEDGLVKQIERNGRTNSFAGAKGSAGERYAIERSEVVLTKQGAPPAAIEVDRLGRPTSFANRPASADDDGRQTRTSDANGTSGLFYDTSNPVHRFRGNLLGTVQEGRASYRTTNTYDGTAWNRLASTVDERGVTNTYSYEMAGQTLSAIVETTGPIQRRSTLNEYAQVQQVDLTEGGYTLSRQILYNGGGLADGEKVGDLAESRVARSPSGNLSASRQGQQFYATTPNDDGQVLSLTGPHLPSTGFGYEKGALTNVTSTAEGATRSVDLAYAPDNPTRFKNITINESGLSQPFSTSVNYDSQGRIKEMVAAGETNKLSYDGMLVTRYEAPGIDRRVSYDGVRVTNVVEQGVTLGLTYDGEGRVWTTTSRGLTRTLTYHQGGAMASKTLSDADRVWSSESYTYDGAGRLSTVTAGTTLRRLEYFPDGVIRRSFLNDRLVKETFRDSSGRTSAVLIPGLVRTEFDDFDPVTGVARREESKLYLSDPSMAAGAFVSVVRNRTVDGASRVRKLAMPCGEWSYDFDGFGNLKQVTDPDGVVRAFTFSPGGLPLSTTFEDGTRATFTYDANHRLEAKGGITYGRGLTDKTVERVTFPDSTTLRYGQKNAFGQHDLVFQGGLVQQLSWVDGRLEQVTSGSESMSYGFDRLGRLVRVKSEYRQPDGTTAQCDVTFGFDDRGQAVSETNRMNLGDTPVRTWTGTFDDSNRFTGETYPSGLAITWENYDHGHPRAAPAVGLARIGWLGPGELTVLEYSGGLRVLHHLDASLRRTNIVYERGPASAPVAVAGFDYGFSAGGRVMWERRRHEGRTDVYERSSPAHGMRISGYRFSAEDDRGGSPRAAIEGLRFNVNGELLPPTNRLGSDSRAFMPHFELTNDLRLASADGVPVAYDADWGSVSSVPVWIRLPGQVELTREVATLHYDGFGMVRAVERGSGAEKVTVSYVRDGRGRFVRRIVEGPPARCRPGVWQYAWRRDQPIEEYEVTGSGVHLVRRYVYVGGHLALVQSAATPGGPLVDYVPLVSLNHSVGGYLTTAGDLVEVIRYGAYGAPSTFGVSGGVETERDRSAVASTLMFQGGWFDEETGLYQLGERNLHPQLGRFLQRDTVLYSNSRALFAAFNGDPAGRVDPSGADSTLLTPALNEFQNGRYNTADAMDKGKALYGALFANEGMTAATRVGSVLSSGPDFLNAAQKFAGAKTDEEYKSTAESMAPALDSVKLMGDILQTAGQMQERRALLSAIQAEFSSPFKSVQANFLHSGGALADLKSIDDSLWEHEDLESARFWKKNPDKFGAFLDDRREQFREENNMAVKKLAHGFTKLGAALAERYVGKIEDPEKQRYCKGFVDVAKGALDITEKVLEVMENKALSSAQFGLNAASAKTLVGEVFGAKSYLLASFDIGYTAGAAAIVAFTAPEVSAQYQKDKALFDQFGGFIGLGATVLQEIGMKRVGQFIENVAVDPGFMKTGQQAMERLGRPDPSLDLYLRGLEAP